MPAPKAMSSSVKTPGFYLKVNLLAAASAVGGGLVTAALVSSKLSTGDITNDTEVRTCYGPDDVARALGQNGPGHLFSVQFFQQVKTIPLDVVSPVPPSGSAATIVHTASGTPSDTNTWELDVAGRTTQVDWYPGEDVDDDFIPRVIGAINAMRPLPAVAAVGDPGEIVIDAAGPGTWGNDILVAVRKIRGTGGTVTAGGTKLAGGSTEFNATNALGALAAKQYTGLGLVTGNTDAADATSSSNAHRLKTHIMGHNEGLDALLQYGFVGMSSTISAVKAAAIARNNEWMSYTFWQGARSLPGEICGADMGNALNAFGVRPNTNRIGNLLLGLVGSYDNKGDKLSGTEREDLLNHGVTPLDFVPNGSDCVIVNPITTRSQDTAGQPDFRAYYQTDTFGVMAISDDLRIATPQQFPNCSITPDLPPGADSLPAGVVERRDVEAFVYSRLRAWVPLGVANGVHLEAAIAAGEVIVEIDASDESQVNIFVPMKILKPLAKFSGVVHKVG
jgi:phage tail sheath gpL-like